MPDVTEAPNDPAVAGLRRELDATRNELEVVSEAFVDAEFAAEDRGWIRLGMEAQQSFSRTGLTQITRNCRLMAVASPLIKRGLMLRGVYVWGQGVEISARDQEINQVVQDFLDDKSNKATFSSSQARAEREHNLGTDGNVFLALFTSPLTGRVQVRATPFEEMKDVLHNPEDRDEPWFYLREYDANVIEAGYAPGSTRTRQTTRREYHPALGFYPRVRPTAINGIPVRWDAPMLHVHVNRVSGTKWGIPDAYAALTWARAYEGFLTDWARLVKALSRFAWRYSGAGSGSKTSKAAAAIKGALQTAPDPSLPQPNGSNPVGGVAAMSGGALEAIPKSGATIDSDSGRPLAAMAASSLGVPVTMMLADPGITGARAVAETLDKPTILEAGQRRDLWADTHQRIFTYVIEQAIKTPRGPLQGRVDVDEYGRETIDLGLTTPAEGEEAQPRDPSVEIAWPDLNELDPEALMRAIKLADDTGKMPGEQTLRLALTALRVRNVDEIIEGMRDENGEWQDPELAAAMREIERQRGPATPPANDDTQDDGSTDNTEET